MACVTIKRVDTFSTTPFAGNPAGVVCDADCLSKAQMQELARGMKLNLVEFAFITTPLSSKNANFAVHFFTPDKELDISGHAMIAACYSLIEEGRIKPGEGVTTVIFETGIGNVPVEIYAMPKIGDESPPATSGTPAEIPPSANSIDADALELHRIMLQEPVHRLAPSSIPVEEISHVLGIDKGDIIRTGLPVVVASYEFKWLLIPVLHRETLYGMSPDLIKLMLLNKKYGIKTNHLFTLETFSDECTAYSRHFGPAIGLWEDPATAIASAMLAVYLIKNGITTSSSMQIEQGNDADNLARIIVEVSHDKGEVKNLRVGGLAVTSIERELVIR